MCFHLNILRVSSVKTQLIIIDNKLVVFRLNLLLEYILFG